MIIWSNNHQIINTWFACGFQGAKGRATQWLPVTSYLASCCARSCPLLAVGINLSSDHVVSAHSRSETMQSQGPAAVTTTCAHTKVTIRRPCATCFTRGHSTWFSRIPQVLVLNRLTCCIHKVLSKKVKNQFSFLIFYFPQPPLTTTTTHTSHIFQWPF